MIAQNILLEPAVLPLFEEVGALSFVKWTVFYLLESCNNEKTWGGRATGLCLRCDWWDGTGMGR
jgi:hypothetical protein